MTILLENNSYPDVENASFDDLKKYIDFSIESVLTRSLLWKELFADFPEVYEKVKSFLLNGGKRLRPMLFLLFYDALMNKEDKNTSQIENIICAIELIHGFILIHDDVLDKSETRRNLPSTHCAFESIISGNAQKHVSHAPSGEDMAIVAGDMLYAFALNIFLDASIDTKIMVDILKKLTRTAVLTAQGELNAMKSYIKEIGNITEEDLLKIYDMKTSYYSFEGPISTANLISQKKLTDDSILKFSVNAGRAFQILDDINDITESKISEDIIEKKKTIILLYAWQKSSDTNKQKIASFLKKDETTREDLETMCSIIKDSGALSYALCKATEMKNKAVEILKSLKIDEKHKKKIEDYLNLILNSEDKT